MSFELFSTAAWYVVQTKPKKETETFRRLCDLGLKCFLPKVLDFRPANGRSVTIEKPLFPSYLFINFISTQIYYKVKWTKGVVRFVGWGDIPVPIADEVVAIIRNRIDEEGWVRMVKNFRPGEEVRIKSGPFKDIIGVFDRKLPASSRIRVLLRLIDFPASVNLPETLVERI